MKINRIWTALVNVKPKEGHNFEDLVDLENNQIDNNYIGAWIKVIVKADALIDAYNLIVRGISEKDFIVFDFDYIRDYDFFKEDYELDSDYEEAEDLINNTSYIFTIVGQMHPYTDLND